MFPLLYELCLQHVPKDSQPHRQRVKSSTLGTRSLNLQFFRPLILCFSLGNTLLLLIVVLRREELTLEMQHTILYLGILIPLIVAPGQSTCLLSPIHCLCPIFVPTRLFHSNRY